MGRANELDILRGSIARVNATSSPLLVSILGEPGVGKSRLADELLAGLGADVTVLQGRAYAYGDTATFAPVTAIVREIAGIEDEMAPDEAMRRLQEVVDGCCDPSEAERVAGTLGPHDRPGRSEARGIRLRAGRAERIPQSRSRASPVAGPSCSCSKTCTGSVLRCST